MQYTWQLALGASPSCLCLYIHKTLGLMLYICILHKTRGFLMLYMYVLYISMTPYLPCNKNNIGINCMTFYYTLDNKKKKSLHYT